MEFIEKPYKFEKLEIWSYEDLLPYLPQSNPISKALKRSRNQQSFLQSGFYVYTDDIVIDGSLFMDLDKFYSSRCKSKRNFKEMPHWYPVILGNLAVKSAYFHGFVTGNITANNIYTENNLNIPNGCGGDLTVNEILFSNKRKFEINGKTRIDTLLALQEENIIFCDNQIVKHKFYFPKKNRNDDFSLHSKEELLNHFENNINGENLIEKWYGIVVEEMLPLKYTACEKDIRYLKNRITK